jgi:hypothetical protein
MPNSKIASASRPSLSAMAIGTTIRILITLMMFGM